VIMTPPRPRKRGRNDGHKTPRNRQGRTTSIPEYCSTPIRGPAYQAKSNLKGGKGSIAVHDQPPKLGPRPICGKKKQGFKKENIRILVEGDTWVAYQEKKIGMSLLPP